jgi:hypothetical protein
MYQQYLPIQFGEKPQLNHAPVIGRGLRSTLRRVVNFIPHRIGLALQGPRQGSTARFSTFLNNQGSQPIVKLEVARKPIETGVRKALDILSRGHFSKVASKLGYDQVYHNFLLVEMADGKRYVVQKNEVVGERYANDDDFHNERYEIPVPPATTLKSIIDTASGSFNGAPGSDNPNRKFWQYDGKSTNCQAFVQAVVQANHIPVTDQAAQELIKPQDAGALINSLGRLSSIPKIITDAAAIGDRVVFGDGLTKLGAGFRHHSKVFPKMFHK